MGKELYGPTSKMLKMRKFRIILFMVTAFSYFNVFSQTNREFERIIKLSEAMQDIGLYTYKQKDYKAQVNLLERYIDNNNPMFDLNRDLIKEQKDITIITQDNILETVKKIMQKKTSVKNKPAIQGSLFD